MRQERHTHDVVVIGGGQAGLVVGYNLRRAGLDFVILDVQARVGGAWLHGWASLRLCSQRSTVHRPAGRCRRAPRAFRAGTR